MASAIRPADLDKDRGHLINLMLGYLTQRSDERKFDWLYRENPDGPAKAWVAIETNRGEEIVGSAAAIPRRMYIDGREQLGCLLADFWIHPQYRSLGPAIQLQRACIEEFRTGGFALCYDFPQSSMGAVYRRLGILPSERLVRLTKPLRLDKKIGRAMPVPLLRNALTIAGNRWLEFSDHSLMRHRKCTISLHKGTFGEEFSSLEQQVSAPYGICVKRSAAYLNWRYGNHYFLHYEILTARRNNALMAYVVFVDTGEYGQIVDLFGVEDPQILRDLVSAVVFRFRERGRLGINIQLLESHQWVELLRCLGFHVRESLPLVALDSASNCRSAAPAPMSKWFLTYGDIDP
jgi:GNAT superfamily N-acetyltransferase